MMFLRRQTSICREGWYYVAIMAVVLGGAVLHEVNLLLILAGILLGPLLLNWRAVHLEPARAERSSGGCPLDTPPAISFR